MLVDSWIEQREWAIGIFSFFYYFILQSENQETKSLSIDFAVEAVKNTNFGKELQERLDSLKVVSLPSLTGYQKVDVNAFYSLGNFLIRFNSLHGAIDYLVDGLTQKQFASPSNMVFFSFFSFYLYLLPWPLFLVELDKQTPCQ